VPVRKTCAADTATPWLLRTIIPKTVFTGLVGTVACHVAPDPAPARSTTLGLLRPQGATGCGLWLWPGSSGTPRQERHDHVEGVRGRARVPHRREDEVLHRIQTKRRGRLAPEDPPDGPKAPVGQERPLRQISGGYARPIRRLIRTRRNRQPTQFRRWLSEPA